MIGTIKHLSVHLLRKSLLMIHRSFVQPHLQSVTKYYGNFKKCI